MTSEHVREVLGRKRTVEILEYLSTGEFRNYTEIETEIDSSSDTISNSLALLGDYGLVTRREESKRDVRYEITERGDEFLETVQVLDELLREGTG